MTLFTSLSARIFGQELIPGPPTPPRDLTAQISEYVRCIFQDQDGHLWFGTNSDGVCRYDGQSLDYLRAKDGLAGDAVRRILQTADGAMWFATDRGVSRYHHGKFTNYTVANGLSDNNVWSMMLDKGGTIWVGTGGGVCRLVGSSFAPFPIPAAEVEKLTYQFSPKLVWSMFEDREGNMWFGTDGEGARRYDGQSFTTYTAKDGLAGNNVRCILGDREGRIWLGTDTEGVSCYNGATFRNFTSRDGLGNGCVYAMLEDRAGNLWLSTLADGVTRYDGKSFTVFRQVGDLPRTHVQSMLQDKNGNLWFGCSGGLFRFDGKNFINVTRSGPWPEPASSTPAPSLADDSRPMANFSRMVGGEWKTTAGSGTSMYDTWHWGPGRHSLRVMTDGADAAGNPWRALQVFYWHPGRKKVCLLGLNPFARSVAEGTITFEGEHADAVIDLHQTNCRRQMGLRWDFDGPDKYHERLLEATGSDGLMPLTAWDRIREPLGARQRMGEAVPNVAERLRALASFLGHTWEVRGEWASGEAIHFQTNFEWVPYADGIYARGYAPRGDGAASHLLDGYFFHHTGTNALRCLALSSRGAVYEGEIAELDGGALQLDLKGFEGDRVVAYTARNDFGKDGSVRQSVWSLNGEDRTLLLNVHLRRLAPKDE